MKDGGLPHGNAGLADRLHGVESDKLMSKPQFPHLQSGGNYIRPVKSDCTFVHSFFRAGLLWVWGTWRWLLQAMPSRG